jgi:hypothetical protein
MSRGGRRPRRIQREDCAVWCPGGRWGPRRTRVSECYSVLRAEDVYTALLKDGTRLIAPGGRGTATYSLEARQLSAEWTIRANAVWTCGRVFLICGRCNRNSTRLYVPTQDSWPACRRCWGLTYTSRTLHNYKESIWGRGAFAKAFRTSQRDWSVMATHDTRLEWRRRSRERWNERRRLLRRLPA